MKVLFNKVRRITNITSWAALMTMAAMMLFIPVAVISRLLKYPLLGGVEILRLAMVVLIGLGLAYSQAKDAHISIGLLVDRFSPRIQAVFDVVNYTLTAIISCIISWVFFGDAFEDMQTGGMSTDLLRIPFYPFKFIIAIGFILWALESLLKILLSITSLIKNDFSKESVSSMRGEGK